MKKNIVLAALLAAALFVSCASSPISIGAPQSASSASSLAPAAPERPPATGIRELILSEGEQFIDAPYQSPSRPPRSFDCSAFVRYLYGEHSGINLPSSSSAYPQAGERITFKDAQPGDLLLFTSNPQGSQVNHVAILYKKSASGELRGSILLHAVSIPTQSATIKGNPNTTGVKISELGKRADGRWQQEYFLSRFYGTRRVIK